MRLSEEINTNTLKAVEPLEDVKQFLKEMTSGSISTEALRKAGFNTAVPGGLWACLTTRDTCNCWEQRSFFFQSEDNAVHLSPPSCQ